MNIWPWKKKESKSPEVEEEKPVLSDVDRVTNYFASGGEIVDLSNKPRLSNDGFASDHELMQPYNQAHTRTKKGLASLAARNKR